VAIRYLSCLSSGEKKKKIFFCRTSRRSLQVVVSHHQTPTTPRSFIHSLPRSLARSLATTQYITDQYYDDDSGNVICRQAGSGGSRLCLHVRNPRVGGNICLLSAQVSSLGTIARGKSSHVKLINTHNSSYVSCVVFLVFLLPLLDGVTSLIPDYISWLISYICIRLLFLSLSFFLFSLLLLLPIALFHSNLFASTLCGDYLPDDYCQTPDSRCVSVGLGCDYSHCHLSPIPIFGMV